MPHKLMNSIRLLVLFLASAACYYFLYVNIINRYNRTAYLNISPEIYKGITSIQYEEKKETSGIGYGMDIIMRQIAYVYPDKLRIELTGDTKVIEIYNKNKYVYYDGITNSTKVKECFPFDKSDISEIEKKMRDILQGGEYEFFGYEEKDNVRMKVIGIKSSMDSHDYMHKIWISEKNGAILPYREEYFVDYAVVSKSTYTYIKVNEPIDSSMFEIASLPSSDIIDDGVLPKFVESYNEAQKYIGFKLILPESLPDGFIPSEIGVIPPVRKPSFYCIYFDNGYRIYLNEKAGANELAPNASLGSKPCRFYISEKTASIEWNENGIYISLSGDREVINGIINIAEQISKGKFNKNQDEK